jgi:hypothetical protein
MAASPRAVATGNRPCNNDAQTHQMASDLLCAGSLQCRPTADGLVLEGQGTGGPLSAQLREAEAV